MNEKASFAVALSGSLAVVGSIWFASKLPLGTLPHSAWFTGAVLAFAVLAFTFEFSRRNLQRTAGVALLLIGLMIVLGQSHENALKRDNILDVLNRHGEYGFVCLGAALLILTGGIDLSIGSVVGLAAVVFGLLMEERVPPIVALGLVILGGMVIGAVHGLLVTQMGLQAFLVTLCGMFVYRGIARSIQPGQIGRVSIGETLGDDKPGFDQAFKTLRYWLTGQNPEELLVFPAQLVLMLVLAAVAAVFLHRTAFGRFWYAIGYNEQAARYAGITVWKHKVVIFALCSGLAALGGAMRLLSAGSVTPSSEGSGYELYAITAAVLGGVSLRGGEGTAVGIVLGALVLPVVTAVMGFTKCPSEWEPWMIGVILLTGTVADELIRRRSRLTKS